MKPDIDTLVADICASHPELAGDVSALRAIVAELVAQQPTVTVDDAFKARLRTSLLTKMHQQPKAKAVLPWWFIYTVPVGVTALLLLVVYPQLSTTPHQPLPPDVTYPAADSSMNLKMGSEAASEMDMATMGDAGIAVETTAVSNDFFTAIFTPDRGSLKITYLELGQPGFIVVSGPEGTMATSGLIEPGVHTNMLIPLTQPPQSGATYIATLYYDSGDGVFSAEQDPMVYDQSGLPVTLPLIAP